MLKVEEIVSIKVTIDYKHNEWDPLGQSKGSDSTLCHKAKLMNERVMKYAPILKPFEFYKNISRFAKEQGFGDLRVIKKVTEEIYKIKVMQLWAANKH